MIEMLAAMVLAGSPIRPDVGFIWHFPFVDVGTPLVSSAGVTAMVARAPWVVVEPSPGQFDFAPLHRQLAEAEKGDFALTLLIECNPFCAPPWLRERVRAAGQAVYDGGGHMGDIPSTTSAVFAAAQRRFVRAAIAEVMRLDTNRRVTAYQVGVEWWFPDSFRYAPSDVARFRRWLARRHGTVDALNSAWGVRYARFADVPAPRLGFTGDIWKKGRAGLQPVVAGRDVPVGRGAKAAAYDWASFWQETAADYVVSLARLAKRLDPTRRTVTFLTHSFSSAAEWDYVDWSAMRPDEVARRSQGVDEVGMQLPIAHGDPYRVAVILDLIRKYGKPMTVLDLLDFTDGVRAGPRVMEHGTLTAAQHGATGVFYCCWNGAKDFNFHPDWPIENLRGMVRTGRNAIEVTRGMRIVPDGAIVLPIMPGAPGSEARRTRSMHSFMGWYRLLQGLHTTVDVLTLSEIEAGADLRRYPWVLMPHAPAAPRRSCARLAAYARYGRLICAGDTPSLDEYDRPLVFPIHRARKVADHGAAYAGAPVRQAEAGDTPPMVIWEGPGPDGADALESARAELLPLLLTGDRPGGLAFRNVPPEVTVTRWEGANARAAWLVNSGSSPASGVMIALPDARASVRLWLDGKRAEPCRRSGAGVEAPPFRASCVVIVGPK